jgi:hypothetical protein
MLQNYKHPLARKNKHASCPSSGKKINEQERRGKKGGFYLLCR